MRFIVLGAGAIGGVIGGRLTEYGHEVVLVARGQHFDALSHGGLRLESPEETTMLPVPAVESPDAIDFRDDDAVILATKSQDTADAIRALASVAPARLPIFCAQNGVENERIALRLFSVVYGICVMCPATHLQPGVVQAHSHPVTGLLDVGRWPHGKDALAHAVASALNDSTFNSEVRSDIARWKWGKLLVNLGNGIEAVCGGAARFGEVAKLVRQEGVACLEAGGIDYVGKEEDLVRRGDLLSVRPVGDRPRRGSSSWQSLVRSTGAIETDYLNGEIVLLGRMHGVPTPANALVQELANQLARQRAEPGSIGEGQLLDMLNSST
jgi:2-dehydropantoate 2-reductase